MSLTNAALFLALVLCVQSKYIPARALLQDLEDHADIVQDNHEDLLLDAPVERFNPEYLRNSRVRRQVGSMNTNPDGSSNLNVKLPIAGNDQNRLSALGSVNGFKDGKFAAAGGGLALDNVNGHGLSLTGTHIPNFGNQMTAAARASLLQTENHRLGANAFITKNMPTIPNVPDFHKYGGGLDYMYKNKVGASLGMSHTDLLQRNDYSAMGNLNLFRGRDSSLDLNAGFNKATSPFMKNTGWQPSIGLGFTKYW